MNAIQKPIAVRPIFEVHPLESGSCLIKLLAI